MMNKVVFASVTVAAVCLAGDASAKGPRVKAAAAPVFEGALPRYPYNSFPNWYGACLTWGRYSSSGTARW
jgi:hypothetical protein